MPFGTTAAEIGSALRTVKLHRARVMEKMQARSLAELVRIAEELGVGEEPKGPFSRA